MRERAASWGPIKHIKSPKTILVQRGHFYQVINIVIMIE